MVSPSSRIRWWMPCLGFFTCDCVHAFIPRVLPPSMVARKKSGYGIVSCSNYQNEEITSTASIVPFDIDFASSLPAPGEISPMAWEGEILSENSFRVGMPTELVRELRSYADRMGIMDCYRDLLIDNNPLEPGSHFHAIFGSHRWLVQRPEQHWCSNMHWASPANESAHNDYLRALSAGGFDQVLESIGAYFGMDALSAYQLSFIGVSHCEKGFIHGDMHDSGKKAFNLIIPLMLESDTGPELEIMSDDEASVRYYKYRINTASMVGDDAWHATAACDYRLKRSMRLAATVYVGDINTGNVNQILMRLTQEYPPNDAIDLLEMAGMHWSSSDAAVRLPVTSY